MPPETKAEIGKRMMAQAETPEPMLEGIVLRRGQLRVTIERDSVLLEKVGPRGGTTGKWLLAPVELEDVLEMLQTGREQVHALPFRRPRQTR